MSKKYDLTKPLSDAEFTEMLAPNHAGFLDKINVVSVVEKTRPDGRPIPFTRKELRGIVLKHAPIGVVKNQSGKVIDEQRITPMVESFAAGGPVLVDNMKTEGTIFYIRNNHQDTMQKLLSEISNLSIEMISIGADRPAAEIDNIIHLSRLKFALEIPKEAQKLEKLMRAGLAPIVPVKDTGYRVTFTILRDTCRDLAKNGSLIDAGILFRSASILGGFMIGSWSPAISGFLSPDEHREMIVPLKDEVLSKAKQEVPEITDRHSPFSLARGLKGALDELLNSNPNYSEQFFNAWFHVHFLPEKMTGDHQRIAESLKIPHSDRVFYSKLAILTMALDGMQRLSGPNFNLMIMPGRDDLESFTKLQKAAGLNNG